MNISRRGAYNEAGLRRRLTAYEERFGMTSWDFFQRWERGEFPPDDAYFAWAGICGAFPHLITDDWEGALGPPPSASGWEIVGAVALGYFFFALVIVVLEDWRNIILPAVTALLFMTWRWTR